MQTGMVMDAEAQQRAFFSLRGRKPFHLLEAKAQSFAAHVAGTSDALGDQTTEIMALRGGSPAARGDIKLLAQSLQSAVAIGVRADIAPSVALFGEIIPITA